MNDEGMKGLVVWEMVVMKWLVEMSAVVPGGRDVIGVRGVL
jgi:hypothetical protein